MYFGIVAELTPPVALAAYAGAAIAQDNPMKTALTSTKLAIAAFIVPYIFALNPEMLFLGDHVTVGSVVLISVSSVAGIVSISAALEGYFLCDMEWYERLICVFGGLLMVIPGILTDVAGFVLVAAVVVLQYLAKKNKTPNLHG